MERFMGDDMLVEHGKDTPQMLVKYEDCVQEIALTKADAQATIATLQSRVKELEHVRGERDHAKKMEAVQKEVADNQTWHVQKLRALIAALPKVEGEIAVKPTEVDLSGVWGITFNGYFTFQSALFDSKEEADAYAALLTHRQGMEGQS